MWTFIEAANVARRFSDEARRFFDKKKNKTNSVVVTNPLDTNGTGDYHIRKGNSRLT
jgi:transposase